MTHSIVVRPRHWGFEVHHWGLEVHHSPNKLEKNYVRMLTCHTIWIPWICLSWLWARPPWKWQVLPYIYVWWFRNPVNSPVEVGSLSHYLQTFVLPRWLFGSSSINSSSMGFHAYMWSWTGRTPTCASQTQPITMKPWLESPVWPFSSGEKLWTRTMIQSKQQTSKKEVD